MSEKEYRWQCYQCSTRWAASEHVPCPNCHSATAHFEPGPPPSRPALDHELWQGIYKAMAAAIHLMVLSSASHDEARRRIGVIRLELAVAEGSLGALDRLGVDKDGTELRHRVSVHEDAGVDEGTCLAEVESLPPSSGCPGSFCGAPPGTPLNASDIDQGVCRYCGNVSETLAAFFEPAPSESTDAERTCRRCNFVMKADGWRTCPQCGEPTPNYRKPL